jgi:type I restriction enzyme S subunit
VPEHWVVGRYKFCTSRIVVGIAEAATHAYAETGVPIIRSTNIREDGIDNSGMLFIKEAFAEKNDSKYLYANDVITVRTGYPGTSAVIPEGLDKSHCFTNLIATPKRDILPTYLSEYLNSHTGKSYFDLLGWGSAQKNISVPILQNVPIAWPDESEQSDIMNCVQNQRGRYTKLVSKAEQQIILLQERRTALISAAVTGKIDVRNWVAPEPSATINKDVAA